MLKKEHIKRTNKMKLLYKFLFNAEGNRSNRKRTLEFSGFDFQTVSTEFKNKISEIQSEFPLKDVITHCNLLGISNNSLDDLNTD